MREEAIEQEQAAGLERSSHAGPAENLRIANLPVAPLEVDHRSLAMLAGQKLHATVLDVRFIKGNPDTHHFGVGAVIEIGHVLMPRFFAAQPRRLEQRHILEQNRLIADQRPHHGKELGMIRQRIKAAVEIDETGELAHRILPLLEAEARQDLARALFEINALEIGPRAHN